MGFFKKVGNWGKKNISFKNAVHGVAKFGSFIPVVGGALSTVVGTLSEMHEAKKQAREQEAQQAQAQADFDKAVAEAQARGESVAKAQMQATQRLVAKDNPNIGDILIAGGGGALTAMGNKIGGSADAGTAGSSVVDSTLTAWFKKNWLKLIGFVLGSVLIIKLFSSVIMPKKPTYKRRY